MSIPAVKYWRLAVPIGLSVLVGIVLFSGDPEKPGDSHRLPSTSTPQTQTPIPKQWTHRDRQPQPTGRPPRVAPPTFNAPDPYTDMQPLDHERIENFRFRPLSEREQRRIQRQGIPPGSLYGDYLEQSVPWIQGHSQSGFENQDYSFRPLTPSTRGRQRWQGPHTTPNQPWEWSQPTPGAPQGPSQWGSMSPNPIPPAKRMYPSLDRGGQGRTLTGRL